MGKTGNLGCHELFQDWMSGQVVSRLFSVGNLPPKEDDRRDKWQKEDLPERLSPIQREEIVVKVVLED
jgi:hypothetical protein